MTDPAPLPPAPAGDKPGTIAMLRMVGALREQVGRKIRFAPVHVARPLLERAQRVGERLDFTAMDAMTQARVSAAVLVDTAARLQGIAPSLAADLAGGAAKLMDALRKLEAQVEDLYVLAGEAGAPGDTINQVYVVAPGSDPPPDLVAKYGESTVRALARPLPTSLLADLKPAGFAAGGMVGQPGERIQPWIDSSMVTPNPPKAARRPHSDDLEEHLRRVGEAAGEGDGKPPEDVPF